MKIFFNALFPLTALVIALVTAPEVNAAPGLNLTGPWKIIESDDPAAAAAAFNDAPFPTITLPGNWLPILKKNKNLSATVWIRKKIFIPAGHVIRQPVLFIEKIGLADEAYFNGIWIGSSGLIPSNPADLHYQLSWAVPRRYFIPGSLVRYGAENVIALRVYSHIQSGVQGDIEIRDYRTDYFGQLFRSYRPLFTSAGAVIINLMLIMVFALLYLSERSKTEYLYFTLVIVCTLLCTTLTFSLPFSIDGLWRHKLGVFLYTLTNFFVLLGVKKFLGYTQRWITVTALSLLIGVELGVLLAPSTDMLVFVMGYVFLSYVCLCILGSAALFFFAVKKDPRRYWYFLFLAIPVPISVLRNSFILMSFRFNELPLVIILHVPIVFMFFTLYYIYDFEKSRKEKDLLYTALLKKSKNDMRRLQSRQEKSKKPEPRNLIASVIEYLDANYAEKYDRIELSKQFGLNEDYMGQIFKKATGMNISNYINTNRINAAKELLTGTGAKIIDVAYHVGFDNLTHFHRQFKKQTGCTPNEYRSIVKKEG